MRNPTPKRGSALLIVLGLLGFLLISAVAFAISMRTEKSAASTYRTGLMARELLTTAFAEARFAVDSAMKDQLQGTDPLNVPSARTAQHLAPFYDEGTGRYARLLASAENGKNPNGAMAYLLDDAAMRHIPPAIAYPVYEILEQGNDPNGTAATGVATGVSSSSVGYNFDMPAQWQVIDIARPEQEVSAGSTTRTVSSETVGRMAWTAINVSDMLDINAIGSFSQYRGIGLTGTDFAFGMLSGSTGSTQDSYDLITTSTTADPNEFPLFASGADLALFAARGDAAPLKVDVNGIYPYSWENAVAEEGVGPYAPFTVYGFWPDERRRTEDGQTSNAATLIPCSDIDTAYVTNGLQPDLARQIEEKLPGSSGSTQPDNFFALLRDYVDTDSVPGETASPANTIPTVEPVPMVAEVGYFSTSRLPASFKSDLVAAIKDAFLDGESKSYTKAADVIAETTSLAQISGSTPLKFKLPALELPIAVRTYFPGASMNPSGSFQVEVEGFAGGYVEVRNSGEEVANEKQDPDAMTTALTDTPGTVAGGADAPLFTTSSVSLTSADFGEVSLDPAKIKMNAPDANTLNSETVKITTEPAKVTVTCLVDFIFRVVVNGNEGVADVAPVYEDGRDPLQEKDYPAGDASNRALSQRLSNKLRGFDRSYFRVTRPVSVTFGLVWEIEGKKNEQGQASYTAKVKVTDSSDKNKDLSLGNTNVFPVANGITMGGMSLKMLASGGDPSWKGLSPDAGAWFTIDPRYNWLSPMMGVSDNAQSYGVQSSNLVPSLSSPHWLFETDAAVGEENETPSQFQVDYADQAENAGLVPFVWQLEPQHIRYGYGNTGTLLLPQEVGFLPVPFATNTWTPQNGLSVYNAFSIGNYYTTVARASFFRTIPVTDFDDNAFTGMSFDYQNMVDLTTLFGRFGGENLHEEHRGILSAFAGMDNYYLSQRLKQFAMMGIPASIQEAAKVTLDRATVAEPTGRIPEKLVADLKTDLESSTKNVTLSTKAKYDEFVRDYLFFIPDESSSQLGTYSWETDVKLDSKGTSGRPTRPQTVEDVIIQRDANTGSGSGGNTNVSFSDKLKDYNASKGAADKLGQNDLTTLVAIGNSVFGDRQQLFLYIMRADTIKTSSSTNRALSDYRPLSTARAVALVWRDAYGVLPERVVYFQYLP